jgi:hypothetical protein
MPDFDGRASCCREIQWLRLAVEAGQLVFDSLECLQVPMAESAFSQRTFGGYEEIEDSALLLNNDFGIAAEKGRQQHILHRGRHHARNLPHRLRGGSTIRYAAGRWSVGSAVRTIDRGLKFFGWAATVAMLLSVIGMAVTAVI